MKTEIINTDDGSHSLILTGYGETYHSKFGAISESKHIYINQGLHFVASKLMTINLLEVGFGTGLNAFLTMQESKERNLIVNYIALEPFPLPGKIYQALNYPLVYANDMLSDVFLKMHKAPVNKEVSIADGFFITKYKLALENSRLPSNYFDLVYYDAFAPDLQPEMWTQQAFEIVGTALKPNGALVTFSSKGEVRRNMQKAGFKVEKIKGPKGKHEIVRAIKK
ncbi:MAG: tRNA (5-methylaminomethyl-2-thiouridine)(34)-methyltransferase MnmD [Bacteroidales bacterium]|nr:tRNA (5-methylaminomethyl-2-thiouridine)(34)-methyltransferase MnmD [Bacteroidales bacterium]